MSILRRGVFAGLFLFIAVILSGVATTPSIYWCVRVLFAVDFFFFLFFFIAFFTARELTIPIRMTGNVAQTNESSSEAYDVSLWRTCIGGNCTFITWNKDSFKSNSEGPLNGAIAGTILSAIFSLAAFLAVLCRKKTAVVSLAVIAVIFGAAAIGCWGTFIHFGPKATYAEATLHSATGLEVAIAALACK